MSLSFYLKIIDCVSRFPSHYWGPSRAGNNLLQKGLTLRAEGFLWKDQIHSSCLVPAAGRNTSHRTEIPHIAQKSPSWMWRSWGWRRSGLSLPFLLQWGFSTISSQKTADLGLLSSCSSAARNACLAGEWKRGKQRLQQLTQHPEMWITVMDISLTESRALLLGSSSIL